MIKHIEKGYSLIRALSVAGLHIQNIDGGWQSEQDHDIINQFIIDFDEVAAIKTELKSQLVIDSQEYVDSAILKDYPKFEVDTWQNQLSDAKAFLDNPSAITLTLDSLSTKRGKAKTELANKIIVKFTEFSVFSGNQAGERQRLEDLIDSAETVEALNAIPKFAGV